VLNRLVRRMALRRSTTSREARRGECGSAAVEFALSAMLLLALMLGIINFGWAIFSYNFISNAAREGTRYAMVHGATCASDGSSCAASSSDIQNYVIGLAPGAINSSALTVTAYCGPGGSSPPSGDCGASTAGTPNNNPGNVVYVQVKYTFTSFTSLVPVGPISMQTASERVIWQ
jgi:Flp pilus assembly protein TadG